MSERESRANAVDLARMAATSGAGRRGERVMIYLPHLMTGGAEIAMIRLARGLVADGCAVTLILHAVDAAAIELAPDLPMIDLRVSSTLAALPRLVQLLRRERPDILLTGLTHNNIMATAAVWLSGHPCRLVVTEHAPVTSLSAARSNWRYRILPKLLPMSYPLADAVVSVSSGVAQDLATLMGKRAKSRLHVIYNPVLPSNWEALAASPVDDPWLAEGAPPVILAVGRLSVEKNLPLLLKAFSLLQRRGRRARLMILGDGPEHDRLMEEVRAAGLTEQVRMPGRVPHPFAYMRRASVFVLTSTFEGFGNVLVEAMAAGTPVVSTDCPVGPREILADGRYGQLVTQPSPEALADAIERALGSRAGVDAARTRALDFTVQNSVAAYRALFARLQTAR
jgi:glycosyltransferase involved in cell wall biosynthesis